MEKKSWPKKFRVSPILNFFVVGLRKLELGVGPKKIQTRFIGPKNPNHVNE
jgi:hypothetical protein